MPLPSLNFQNVPTQNTVPDIFGSLLRGYELGSKPAMMRQQQALGAQELKAKMLQNMLTQRFGQQERESKLALQKAQTDNQMRQAEFGNFSGPAAKLLSMKMLENKFGADNPIVIAAKEDYQLEKESQKLLNKNRQILNESAPKRYGSILNKLLLEEQEIDDEFLPGTNGQTRLSPEKQEALKGQYQNLRLKNTTDPGTRERMQYAINMDKTIDAIDVDSLVQFSGPKGGIKRIAEQAKSLKGKASKEYKEHAENLTRIKTFAKQFRQFNKDSVTNANQERLEYITNPTNWETSPEIAKAKLEALFKLAKNENKTIQNALKSPNEMLGQQENPFSKALKNKSLDFSALSDEELETRIQELQNGR